MLWILRPASHSHLPLLLPPTLRQYGEGSQDNGQKTQDADSWWRVEQPLVLVQIPSSGARRDGGTSETAEVVFAVIENELGITTYASCMPEHHKRQVCPGSGLMFGTNDDSLVHEHSYEEL